MGLVRLGSFYCYLHIGNDFLSGSLQNWTELPTFSSKLTNQPTKTECNYIYHDFTDRSMLCHPLRFLLWLFKEKGQSTQMTWKSWFEKFYDCCPQQKMGFPIYMSIFQSLGMHVHSTRKLGMFSWNRTRNLRLTIQKLGEIEPGFLLCPGYSN